MTHYEVDPERYIDIIASWQDRPTPVIGDMISIKGKGTFVCCGAKDDPSGYCTREQCCFYCDGCTAAHIITCIGIHWFTPVEDNL